jgi:hypothetical protein
MENASGSRASSCFLVIIRLISNTWQDHDDYPYLDALVGSRMGIKERYVQAATELLEGAEALKHPVYSKREDSGTKPQTRSARWRCCRVKACLGREFQAYFVS